MSRAKFQEYDLILSELQNTMNEMQNTKEWLSIKEMADYAGIGRTCLQTLKDRYALHPYVKFTTEGCKIKNCPEVINLLRHYKYRNFEYEQELLRNKIHNRT